MTFNTIRRIWKLEQLSLLSIPSSFIFLLMPLILYSTMFPRFSSAHYCQTEKDCGDFMMCFNNKCTCDYSSENFDIEPTSNLNSCKTLALIGEKCNNVTKVCAKNAICSPNEVCICAPGYEEARLTHECRRPYGSSCNSIELCNPEKYLSCSSTSQMCKCHNEADFVYDFDKGTCVGRIGHTCEFHSWMGIQLGCSENAHCSKTDPLDNFFGVCKCNSGYTQATMGSHICEAILLGRKCHSFAECEEAFNAECVDTTCQCKNGSVNIDNNLECRLLVGENCKGMEDHCVQNAKCISNYNTSVSSAKTCQCSPGFLDTSGGLCQLGPGSRNCSLEEKIPSQKCHEESGLQCIDNFCLCPEGLVFDLISTSCVGLHGSPCKFSKDEKQPQCVEHADCNEGTQLCQCKDTFLVDENGQCKQSYGTLCSLESSREVTPATNTTTHSFCPKKQGLVCQGPGVNGYGRCSCLEGSGTIFDKDAGRCLLRIGQNCSFPIRRCVSHAFCGTGNKCQCYNKYSPTPEGHCLLDYDQLCGRKELEEKKCNFYLGLECINDKCGCSNDNVYNSSLLRCVNLVVEIILNATTTTTIVESEDSTISISTEGRTMPNNPGFGFSREVISLISFMIFLMLALLAMVFISYCKQRYREYCLV